MFSVLSLTAAAKRAISSSASSVNVSLMPSVSSSADVLLDQRDSWAR